MLMSQESGNLIITVIIMLYSFKYLIFLSQLLAAICSTALQTSYNYDYLQAHEEALIAQPIFIRPTPIASARHLIARPSLLQFSNLRKYELRDTDYRAEDHKLSYEDQNLLFSMEPPPTVFTPQPVVIENYRLLELRMFKIEIRNPSKRLTMQVMQIITDRFEIKHEHTALPVTLHPGVSHEFTFVFYASELNPQHIQSLAYFCIEIYDGNILAEQKVYAKKVTATITPNHLRLETHVFRNCPRYQTVVIKNYEIFEIGVKIDADKHFDTIEGISLKDEVMLQPTKSIKILVDGKFNQIMILSRATDQSVIFPILMVQIMCEQSLTIDYFNIGIIPDEKHVFEFPLTITNHRNDNATIKQIHLESTSQTVIFQEMKFHSQNIVAPLSRNLQIGIIRILSRKQPEKKSVITIKIKVSTGLEEFWTEQKLFYQEMRSPISAGARRFVDLTKNHRQPNRFTLKNNLCLPLFLTRFSCDQSFLQLVWTGQRRKVVYPNLSIEELALKYVGPQTIPISPQKFIILLQFNGNLIVPLQIIVYDKTLQCLVQNQVKRCSEVKELYFEFNREEKVKGMQLVFRNWNPEYLSFYSYLPTQLAKEYGLNMTIQLFGPMPGEGKAMRKREQEIDTILDTNQFMVVDIEIQLLEDAATTSFMPLKVTTGYEEFEIFITTRIQNGTIALIPQVVRFEAPFQRTIEYLNLVSTYAQSYRIKSVKTNLSCVLVAVPPHSDLKSNQFVGMTVVYDPFLPELNITSGDWSTLAKQQDYYEFTKRKGFIPILYAQVTLETTTKLQAQSTIIIDKAERPMIASSQLKDESRGIRSIQFILPKRRPKAARYSEPRQAYEIIMEVTNNFALPLKYKPFLLSEYRYSVMDRYFKQLQEVKANRKLFLLMCFSDAMKSRYRLNPSAIKEIFSLDANPDEYLLQSVQDEEDRKKIVLIPKVPKNITMTMIPRDMDVEFILKLYHRQSRNCICFQEHQYLAKLLMSDLPYIILEEEGERAFRDFVKSQQYNLQHSIYFQGEVDYHLRHRHYSWMGCLEKSQYSIFGFCQPSKSRVHSVMSGQEKVAENSDQTYVLGPGQSHRITVQIFNPPDSSKLNIVLANNISHFETYLADIQIIDPQLYVKSGYFSPLKDQLSEETWGKVERANSLPIEVFLEDYSINQDVLEGSRTFQLINEGKSDIVIDHVGIDQKFYSCGQKGIELFGINCGTTQHQIKSIDSIKKNSQMRYILKSLGHYNLTVRFFIRFKELAMAKKLNFLLGKKFLEHKVYLYDDKGYHYRLDVIIRIADPLLLDQITVHHPQSFSQTKYGYIIISVTSFCIICVLSLRIKAEQTDPMAKLREERERVEDDPYKRMYRLRKLGRILKQPTYFDSSLNVGTKLSKKTNEKCIHKVTEDLLLSAKEVTQRQLKKYFNESQQSAIGAILDIHHHLSLSQSISDHEVLREEETELLVASENDSKRQESSELPEGEEVDLASQADEDSMYDFNRSFNEAMNKSNKNSSIDLEPPEEQEFYNVFRSEVGLKKTGFPIIAYESHKRKRQ